MTEENKEEMLLEEDDVITLQGPDGQEIDFVEIACIELEDDFYAILQPVDLPEDMEENEALVFKMVGDGEDECTYEVVADDDIIDAVFEEYNKLLN